MPESESKWVNELKIISPKDLDSKTFYAWKNDSRKFLKKGDPAFIRYRKASNMTLLVHYGFCLKDNIYDSVRFLLKMNMQ